MKNLLTTMACLLLLSACSNESLDKQAESVKNEPAKQSMALPDDDDAWAKAVVDRSAKWTPVTPEPVTADRLLYTFCRAAGPADHKNGPHYRTIDDPEQVPANQFMVSDQARPYFYEDDDATKRFTLEGQFPVGSVIAKEKYDDIDDAAARKSPTSVAVMVKREAGYDDAHNNCEYGYIELDTKGGVISTSRGKLANCIDCHGNRSNTDYVYRDYPLVKRSD